MSDGFLTWREDASRGHPSGLEELANVLACLATFGLLDLEQVRAQAALDDRERG